MKKFFSLWIWIVAGMLLPSCSTLQTLSFEQLQAGEVSFPEGVRKVAIINNMPVMNANEEEAVSEWEGDGKIATEVLAENIANVNYFDEVIICDSVFRAHDEEPLANVIPDNDEIQRLAADLGVDLIFSFDRVHIRARRRTLFLPGLSVPVDAVEAVFYPVVRAYVPNHNKPLFVFTRPDSIAWELVPGMSRQILTREISEYAASVPVEHLLPHWREVTRMYYDGGTVEMRDAGVCLRENDWEGAYELWKTTYDKKKARQKMKAAFNLALYYEMKDDLASAKEWIEKAKQQMKPDSKDEGTILYYSLKLDEREEKISRLKMQMKRFEENF